jgi:hypothetical protein
LFYQIIKSHLFIILKRRLSHLPRNEWPADVVEKTFFHLENQSAKTLHGVLRKCIVRPESFTRISAEFLEKEKKKNSNLELLLDEQAYKYHASEKIQLNGVQNFFSRATTLRKTTAIAAVTLGFVLGLGNF